MQKFILVLALLVAVNAQSSLTGLSCAYPGRNVTYSTTVGAACDTTSKFCKPFLFCNNGKCAAPAYQSTCTSNANCDPEFFSDCINGKCDSGYRTIGETCQSAAQCASKICGANGVCGSVAPGGNCEQDGLGNSNACTNNYFCFGNASANPITYTCQPSIAAGANCSSPFDICVSGFSCDAYATKKCIANYQAGVGGSCNASAYFCQPTLACSNYYPGNGGVCYDPINTACNATNLCPTTQNLDVCACNGATSGKCAANPCQSKFNDLLTCYQNNNIENGTPFVSNTTAYNKCRSQAVDAICCGYSKDASIVLPAFVGTCANQATTAASGNTNNGSTGKGSDSSAVAIAISYLLAFICFAAAF